MPAQIGYFDTLKSVAGKVFAYLASITITGVDGKTLTVNDTLTLALGAANLKQFMSAAGTQMEWAAGIKVGTFTVDMAQADGATQAVTGVGFKPFGVIFLGIGSNVKAASVGFDTVANASAVVWRGEPAGLSSSSIELTHDVPYTGNRGKYNIQSMNADGFTLYLGKNGTPTGLATIIYMAFR